MYIGRMDFHGTDVLSRLRQSVNRMQRMKDTAGVSGQKTFDKFTRTSSLQENSIVYGPNRLKHLAPESVGKEEMEKQDFGKEIILRIPCDSDYTVEDALWRHHMRPYALTEEEVASGNFTLPKIPTDEDLENLRQELRQNGLGEEIDWDSIKADFAFINMNCENAERLDNRVDFLASRYAVLKDRIESEYEGEKQTEQMNMLNSTFGRLKEYFADSYESSVGRFFEELGQTGAAGDMKQSLLEAIDRRIEEYSGYLAEAGEYAKLENEEDRWLLQDDAYLAAQLRKSMANTEKKETLTSGNSVYSFDDLKFAGVYAKVLNEQLKEIENFGYQGKDDYDLGRQLADQYRETQRTFDEENAGDKILQLVKDTFEPFMQKLMDKINESVDDNKTRIVGDWKLGVMLRSSYINRDAVIRGFRDAMR